jgi:hypothetical protein
MMNDRFSAELRRHLVETADERPAEGQLASVIDRVDATRQRHPVLARLTWAPGRVGPVPSSALRFGLVVLALALAIAAGALLAGGGGERRPSTPFEGSWITTDPFDGSGMTVVVGPGMSPEMYFEDGYATGGACINDAVKRYTARGTGTIVGNVLTGHFPDGGGCGLMTVEHAGVYEYVARTDMLVDQDGLGWSRALDQDPDSTDTPPAAPSGQPTSEPTPHQTSEPSPAASAVGSATPVECIDLSLGGTYAAPAFPLTGSVVATVPQAPAIPWQGAAGSFFLSSSCADSGPIAIYVMGATDVMTSSCMPDAPEIATFEEALARLDAPIGDDIAKRVDLTIDGYRAARYDVSKLTTCPQGFGLWGGTILGPGETGSIYVIDVDGLLLAVELNRDGEQTPAELDEAQAIVESFDIQP